MILARELQVLASVLGVAKGPPGERSGGIRDAGDIGIANERKNGMIERRGADFDLAVRGGVTIGGENQAQKFLLLFL